MTFYIKVLEVIMDPKNIELRIFFNLRMGTLHASCIFMAVICNHFGAAELEDVSIEASLIGNGSLLEQLR